MKIRRAYLKDRVTVSTYQGDSAYGPTYASPVTIRCQVDPTRRLVLNGLGEQVISELSFSIHPFDATYFSLESKVVYQDRESKVISVADNLFRGGWTYSEVRCS